MLVSGPVDAEGAIREAITARASLALVYGGDLGPARTVHPQVLFRTIAGELCVDCYQLAGYSSSGQPLPGWRDFSVGKIERVAIGGGAVGRAPGLNLAHPKYARILAHL